MKTPAEKCAERLITEHFGNIYKHRTDDYRKEVQLVTAIIQSEYDSIINNLINDHVNKYAALVDKYAPESPDKCAEQAAKQILMGVSLDDVVPAAPMKRRIQEVAAIITESYAPTIQAAREAMEGAEKALELAANHNLKWPDPYRVAALQLRTALDQLL